MLPYMCKGPRKAFEGWILERAYINFVESHGININVVAKTIYMFTILARGGEGVEENIN